jgi:HEAT repeat protein
VSALERLAAGGGDARAAALAACRRDGPLGASRCRLLGRLGEAGDAAALRRALAEVDPGARVAAAGALAALSARGLLAPRPAEMLDALDDREPAVRAAAAEALGTIARGAAAWPEAARALAVALRDDEPAVRAAAAAALGHAGAREYAGALAQLALDPGAPPECAAAAVAALAELGDPDPAILERAARHADPEVVKEAVAAAARLPGAAGAGLLLTAATHPRWDVRRAAARAIGQRGDRALLEPARRLGAAEDDPLVAEALAAAVDQLSAAPR